jgi:hypothetical protein
MTQAKRVHSTPPLNTPIPDPIPPRPLTPQELATELLMRWRLARAAGIPVDKRLEDRQ